MGDIHCTDMRDYLEDGAFLVEMAAPARRLAEHFGRIVGAATAHPPGIEFPSPVPCRRRPKHRRCPGPIRIRRSEVPPRIDWLCASCRDQGLIQGFLGTPWDLSEVPLDEQGERGTVLFDPAEYRALLEADVLDLECEALLLRAVPEPGAFRIEASLELLGYLQEFVSAAADLESRAARRRLLARAYDRLEEGCSGSSKGSGRAQRPARSSASKSSEAGEAVYQLKVTLRHLRPPIWRRIQVPASLTLGQLHEIVQVVMGWTDSHLHCFEIRGESFGVPSSDDWTPVRDERRVRLADLLSAPKDRALYTYDFGDRWEHDIVVEKILLSEPGVDYPLCVTGRRACPPEDVGGPWGYGRMLEVLEDPSDPERDEYLDWLDGPFDPQAFDLAATNVGLRQLLG
jgi:hypothetical protein